MWKCLKCMFKSKPEMIVKVNIKIQNSILNEKETQQKIIDAAMEAAQLVGSKEKWSSYVVRGVL
jgi:hypothetical protein